MASTQILTDVDLLARQIQDLKLPYLRDKSLFKKCTSNAERVIFFLNNEKELAIIKAKIRTIVPSLSKCDNKAVEKRVSGNVEHTKANHQGAAALYTQSLEWAKSDKEISLAYGNRSASLFALGLYEECIKDIDRALTHNFPEHLRPKLTTRKNDAMIKAQRASKKALKECKIPPSEQNPLIQAASKCIEIQTNEKYGKHIVATRDIKIGEILAVEKPFAAILQADKSTDPYVYCYECFDLCFNLIPCPNCRENLYCGESCREKAFDNYHKYECLISPYMDQLITTDNSWSLSLRITLMAAKEQSNDESSDQGGYRSDRYKEISKLESHSNKNPPEQLYVQAFTAAHIFTLMKEKTKIFEDFRGFEERFKELLLWHVHVIKVNAVGIDSWFKENKFYVSVGGVGLYSLFSLFNHSCYNNVFINSCGSTIVCRAYAPIKKGEQCCITYGPQFMHTDRSDRQEILQKQYKFPCACRACKENWPTTPFPVMSLEGTTEGKIKLEVQELTGKLARQATIPPCEEELTLRYLIKSGYLALDGRVAYSQ